MGNRFLLEEVATLANRKVLAYYLHVIENVELDRKNTRNSYVMWLVGKVDALDRTRRCEVREGNIHLPDYDIDFPVAVREKVIAYLREKYGHDRVAHIATFGRYQGREALKAVLRAHDKASYAEMNEITRPIPDEAAVSDDLQESGESSVILWALEHRKEALREWCSLEDGELTGPLALYFAQAMRLEGVRRQRGVHASGMVITPRPTREVAPLFFDRGHPTVGLDMRDAEECGLVKADVLGSLALDELETSEEVIRTGRCS